MQKNMKTTICHIHCTSISMWNLALLVLFSGTLYVWLVMLNQLLVIPIPSLETLISFMASTFLLCVLAWNLLCIGIAYLTSIRFLPRTFVRFLQAFIQHCGTKHSRNILRQHMLRGALAGTLVGSAALHGAVASPLLPTPHADPSPTVESSSPIGFNDVSSPPLLPTPSYGSSAHTETVSTLTHHTVVSGESLWSITENSFPHLPMSKVALKVNELYHVNQSVIGSDPDLILPGMQLTLSTDVKELS